MICCSVSVPCGCGRFVGVFMGKCVFCGAVGKLTREHIWADWLRAYIPKTMTSYEAGKVTINLPGIPDKIEGKKIGGDPHSRRVKCVCGSCNSGWMSGLQERVKPVAIPLIEGHPIKLSLPQQKALAAWIAMAVMCSEFGDKTRIAIHQDHRDILYHHHVPPAGNWRIWIARYHTSEHARRWDHRVLTIVPQKEVDQAAFAAAPFYNTQSTTYRVGELFIHAISSTWRKCIVKHRFVVPGNLLCEIWPARGASISWPPTRGLTDIEANRVAAGFFDAIRRAGLKGMK